LFWQFLAVSGVLRQSVKNVATVKPARTGAVVTVSANRFVIALTASVA
jgi:hypothetical protein